MDDRQIVAALCAQNASGWAAAYDTYAERLYAYSRSILRDHDAAADAVHDAFLIAGQRIRELRDPQRLRPWLYAIVRRECLRQLRTRRRHVELAEAGQLLDESVDLDAGLRAEQHRELIWTAVAGLNPREREVLELSVRHGLDGADLAAALGVSANHAHALVSRARRQLERALTVVIVARTGRRDCATLDGLLTGWNGVLTALWRKRIARHIDHCVACGGTKRREVRASALLATVPLVALPLALRDRVLTAAADPQRVAQHTELATRAGRVNRDGFPRSAAGARRAGLAAPPRLAVPGAAAVLMLGGLLLLLPGPAGDLLAGSSGSTTSIAPLPTMSAGDPRTPTTTGADTQPAPQPTSQAGPPSPASSQSGSPLVAVPNVVGLTQHQGQQKLQAVGLTVGAVSVRNGVSPAQAGVVLSQAPSSGATVQPGSAVALTVGGVPAPSLVTVPTVVGLAFQQAWQRLQAVGLTVGAVSLRDGVLRVEDGIVRSQSPAAGKTVELGSPVALAVGGIPAPTFVRVPNVVGQNLQEAQQKLQAARLTVGTLAPKHVLQSQVGLVQDQHPIAGTTAPPGSPVVLTIGVPLVIDEE
ncbi:MAG: sigma-70 family RNA polymerase sigma factor [Pseudonocardiales bacterium]